MVELSSLGTTCRLACVFLPILSCMDSRKIQARYIARQAHDVPNQESRHPGSDSTLNSLIIGFELNY